MKIAVASGKGGTGKTTVATNLARTVASLGDRAVYVDCDVEEPNGHIFLKPHIEKTREATMFYPVVDEKICTSCGLCAEICRYKAITVLADTPVVFPEMCHSCGGCTLVCPVDAITEHDRAIGTIEIGTCDEIRFIHGRLNVGETMSPPLIRQVKKLAPDGDVVIMDSPPGTSCPVIETVRDADFILLVTEPTPFGLHDLILAVDVVKKLRQPYGVVINRSDIGTDDAVKYCAKNHIPVVLSVPDDRRLAEAYSRGILAVEALPYFRKQFSALYGELKRRAER